ncbi:glutathione transferase [Chromobacterium phragmitis]|uniref:Glutathione transferase n=1 Tax=Chromobacterium phragmitis TaxID=2202141 RepID=A0A344UEL8_9NEIS|nr:glutathione transferase [Chromobacterium phragmitis]AXE32378.1 glutathione transferase [Chromobacterium phragmitis]AXE33716.1 glutathione transferase [Chromobacterium phragmitis]
MLQLHVDQDFFSPYAMAVFIALTEKELPFEVFTRDLAGGEQFEPSYRAQSLTSRVPMLADGGFRLSESSAIIEYLEEAYPDSARVLPADLKARARARQLQAWLRSDLLPLRDERSTETVFGRKPALPLGEAARKAADKLIAVAEAVAPAGGGNLFGDWCVVDAELALLLKRLTAEELPPNLAAYADAQWHRPSMAAWRARQAR